MLIKNIAICNPKSSISDMPYINYIDTASVFDNKLLGVQRLSSNYPSRAQRKVCDNDILISSVRPILKHNFFVRRLIDNCVASTGFIQVRLISSDYLPLYVYYFLTSEINIKHYSQIAETSQSAFPSFSKDVIEDLSIPDISMEEQQHIVNILGSIDEKIENNELLINSLKQMFFLKCNKFFSKSEDYKVGNLLEIAAFVNGLPMQKYRPSTDEYLKVLKIKELGQGFCDENSDLCNINIDKAYIVENGDVIFSWSGTLMVDIWPGEICGLNQHLYKVSSSQYPKWFYYYWICHHLTEFQSIASGKATTIGHIKREDLAKAKVIIPNNFQNTKAFDIIISKIIRLNKANILLKKIKLYYLKKFFN